MRKYSKFVVLAGILAFVLMFFLAFPGYSSTNDLPAAVGGTVTVNSNGVVSAPAGFYASNGLSLANPPVLIFDETFEGWGTADSVTWTNATGWTSTAEVTNGLCNLATHNLLSPWITGRGISGVSVTWSNLVELAGVVEYTTNDADWVQLDTLSDIRIPADGYRLRVSAAESVPGIGDSIALLDRLTVWGHHFPTRIGAINDCAGIAIRVDNPVGNRDAVNLQTLNSRLASVLLATGSSSNWAATPAIQAVNLSGQSLILDPRYTLGVSSDTLSLSFAGQPVWSVIGGGAVIPQIVYFSITGTQITLRVTGAIGWRPYPEWSADITSTNWTRLGTNAITGTYPGITNGQYALSFTAVTNSPAYYRVTAIDEDGATGTTMTISVPLQVDGPVTGAGMGRYATTSQVSDVISMISSNSTSSNAFFSPQWLVSINHITNLVVSSTSGTNYNGPTNGAIYQFFGVTNAYETWADNSLGDNRIRWIPSNSTGVCYYYPNSSFFSSSDKLGPYTGASSFAPWYGTGTFYLAETYYWQTNWVSYLSGGTATLAHITGPATNQFAPPKPAITWSGAWTNILSGITNVLLFDGGYATNMVPL